MASGCHPIPVCKKHPKTLSECRIGFRFSTIIGIYISFILVLGKVIRTMFTGMMSDIKYRQMPYVERIQELIYNLYLARESMDLRLEEELFAKLLFVYRSPETMIKYSRFPKSKEE